MRIIFSILFIGYAFALPAVDLSVSGGASLNTGLFAPFTDLAKGAISAATDGLNTVKGVGQNLALAGADLTLTGIKAAAGMTTNVANAFKKVTIAVSNGVTGGLRYSGSSGVGMNMNNTSNSSNSNNSTQTPGGATNGTSNGNGTAISPVCGSNVTMYSLISEQTVKYNNSGYLEDNLNSTNMTVIYCDNSMICVTNNSFIAINDGTFIFTLSDGALIFINNTAEVFSDNASKKGSVVQSGTLYNLVVGSNNTVNNDTCNGVQNCTPNNATATPVTPTSSSISASSTPTPSPTATPSTSSSKISTPTSTQSGSGFVWSFQFPFNRK